MICLGKDEDAGKGSRLHGMLTTLLSSKLSPAEKEVILEEKYGIETTVEVEGGLERMCNLSERIAERERIDAVKRMIQKGYSKEQILDLSYSETEYMIAETELLQPV